MGEQGASRVEALDDVEGLNEAEVGGVGLVAEGIEDEDVESFEEGPAFVGDLTDIGAVGEVADAEAEDVESAVFEPDRDDFLTEDSERDGGGDAFEAELGEVTGGDGLGAFVEGVAEDAFDGLLGMFVAKDGDWAVEIFGEEAGVVEAEEVVDVVVGVGDGVDESDVFAEELEAHFGGRIDQEVAEGKAHEDAGACALVAGVAGGADLAVAAEDGDSRGGATAKKNELTRRCREVSQATL